MKRRAIGVSVILLAMLGAAGCQNGGDGPLADGKPQQPSAAAGPATAEAAAPKAAGLPYVPGPPMPSDQFPDYVPPKRKPQEMKLVPTPVSQAPIIDGRADEPMWKTAAAIETLDYSSQRPITIKSVVTATDVFFLVTFPDDSPSEKHKTWVWDPKEEVYREGPDREDVFLFKWSMSGNDVSLGLKDPEPHRGDIWFWKARRTNPSGYADDKWQSVSAEPGQLARKIPSSKHGTQYLRRVADVGEPAFEEKFFFQHQGDRLEKYVPRQPEGSRADVRAKGVWADGQWTIEFGRKLSTGHDDDVAFTPGRVHLFGVSCYAMAYDTPHDKWSQPLYRSGDVFDRLLLVLPGRTGK